MNWKPSEVSWSLPKVGKVCIISLVDIVFEKISSFEQKKNNVCFSHPIPPLFFNIRYVSPQYSISECTSQVGQLLLEFSKRTGLSLSLSIQIRLVP